jgi:hypothetical protein
VLEGVATSAHDGEALVGQGGDLLEARSQDVCREAHPQCVVGPGAARGVGELAHTRVARLGSPDRPTRLVDGRQEALQGPQGALGVVLGGRRREERLAGRAGVGLERRQVRLLGREGLHDLGVLHDRLCRCRLLDVGVHEPAQPTRLCVGQDGCRRRLPVGEPGRDQRRLQVRSGGVGARPGRRELGDRGGVRHQRPSQPDVLGRVV